MNSRIVQLPFPTLCILSLQSNCETTGELFVLPSELWLGGQIT